MTGSRLLPHDPGHIMFRRAARVAIVQPLTFAFVLNVLHLANGTAFASFACFGLLALADFGGPWRQRLLAYLSVGAIGLPLIVLGSAVGPYRWLAFVVAMLVAFAVNYAGVLRGYAAAAAVPLLLPFVLALTSAPDFGLVWQRCLGWVIGVGAATAGAMLLWPSYLRSDLRKALANALRVAAEAVRQQWQAPLGEAVPQRSAAGSVLDLSRAVETVHEEYDGKLVRPGAVTSRDRSLIMAIDELDRLAQVLRWDPDPQVEPRPADQQLIAVTAQSLEASANALLGQGTAADPAAVNAARERHELESEQWSLEQFRTGAADQIATLLSPMFRARIVALSAQSIAGNVAGAVGQKQESASAEVTLGGNRLWDPTATPGVWQSLRSQFRWTSPWFRNAVRSAVAVGVAVLIVLLTGVDHGFWIVLGTLTALRFDAAGTARTAWQILVGTVGGFVVGLGIIYFVGTDRPVLWVLLPVTVFLAAYTPGSISLAVGQGSFTAFAITLFALYSPDRFATADFRLLDVVVALIVSLLVSSLLWPRGVNPLVRSTMSDAATTAGDYLVAAFNRLVRGADDEVVATESAAVAGGALALAEETFDLAYCEAGPGLVDTSTWARLTNACADVGYAADVVMSVARNGRSTGGDEGSQQALLRASADVRQRFVEQVDAIAWSAAPGSSAPTAPAVSPAVRPADLTDLPEVRAAVLDCLRSWQRDPSMQRAIAATSLVWLQDWIMYSSWVTGQLPAPRANPGTATQAAQETD